MWDPARKGFSEKPTEISRRAYDIGAPSSKVRALASGPQYEATTSPIPCNSSAVFSARDSREDVVHEDLLGLLVHAASVVVGAGDDDREIEGGDADDAVAAVARHEEGGHLAVAGAVRLEPPQIAILGGL